MPTYDETRALKLKANEELLELIHRHRKSLPADELIDVVTSTLAGTLHSSIAPKSESIALRVVGSLLQSAMARMVDHYGPCEGNLIFSGVAKTTHDQQRELSD